MIPLGVIFFIFAASSCLADDFDWPKSRRERGRLEEMARAGDPSFRSDPSWPLVIDGIKRAKGTKYEMRTFDEKTLVLLEDPETVAKVFAAYRSGDIRAEHSIRDSPGIVKYLAEDFFRGEYKCRGPKGAIPREPIEYRSAVLATESLATCGKFTEKTRTWARWMNLAHFQWCQSERERDAFFDVLRSWWNDNSDAMIKDEYDKVRPGRAPPPPPAQHTTLREEFFKRFPNHPALKTDRHQSPAASVTTMAGERDLSWIWMGAISTVLVVAGLIFLRLRRR